MQDTMLFPKMCPEKVVPLGLSGGEQPIAQVMVSDVGIVARKHLKLKAEHRT
jgi:hypothetical protein